MKIIMAVSRLINIMCFKIILDLFRIFKLLSVSTMLLLGMTVQAHTSEITHPNNDQPRKKFNQNIAKVLWCLRFSATIVGRKYTQSTTNTTIMIISKYIFRSF
jgi:hypothetical protein